MGEMMLRHHLSRPKSKILYHNYLTNIVLSPIYSLSQISVSLGEVFGRVERGSKASVPPFLCAAIHRSSVRLLYGKTLAKSTSMSSLCAMGSTHRSLSSKMLCAIWTMSGLYRKTATCLCLKHNTLFFFT